MLRDRIFGFIVAAASAGVVCYLTMPVVYLALPAEIVVASQILCVAVGGALMWR